MKNWVKPELYVENFELSQHVAAGCDTDYPNIKPSQPGGYITVSFGCSKDGELMNGEGHWAGNEPVYDTNENGKIDYSELVNAYNTAKNGKLTGQGHENHTPVIIIGNTPVDIENQKPFTS